MKFFLIKKFLYNGIFFNLEDNFFIIYGDSFTAGLYQSRSWPEMLQIELNELDVNSDVYNFSFDGGGVFNWSRHYF